MMRIGLTLGDPCGIGPEILCRALREAAPGSAGAALRVFGDRGVLERAGGLPAGVALVEVTALEPAQAEPGRPGLAAGRAQVAYLEAATAAADAGELDALVTAPISKRWALAAGFGFPGHTEYLAARFRAERAVMLLSGPRLRVALVTTHLALRDVAAALSARRIRDTLLVVGAALRSDFGLPRPRVALAALNPHAGEAGAFGDEEERLLAPALGEAAAADPDAAYSGPHVPDAVFRQAAEGRFDAVVALYHDQGLIPLKLLDFQDAVNVTLGLPIVRTSPDHGVAYDLAGSGRADPTPMRRALELALTLAARRAGRPKS